MKLLYSNILPLGTSDNQQTIVDCFTSELKKSDRVDISVGYVSRASLEELEALVDQNATSALTLECTILKVCQRVLIILL